MNTLVKAKNVKFDKDYLIVLLEDERIIQTPLKWYKEFENANSEDLEKWHFICDNTGIEWEKLDCYLSIEAMLKSNANKVA
ncbi:DUF2442 domain-containing protein [Campylobacter jejuni]|uniref:DUF2442 domain-containing protein n=1 Tax=Campylobacter jejuni TaxID=197 RepID=UPI000F80FEA0|nr:DUF2442 domain-containing protein [Campylobacter jejuni]RTK16760.1 DUF2442 domain-containing protein [Campylobacter jejuni]